MTQPVDFIFDFASPNAYFAHHAVKAIAHRTGAAVNYIPCLLGGIFKLTNNQAPFVTFKDVKGKLDYDMLEMRRFVAEHNLLNFKMNPHFPMRTIIIMRGAIAAQEQGVFDAYLETVLKACWEDGKNMSEAEVVLEVLNAAGLDGQKLLESTQDPAVKAKLIANTEAAVARGTFGIPTFYVGDEMFFGKDRLKQVEAEIVRPK